MVYNSLLYFRVVFGNTLLRNFESIFIGHIDLQFSYSVFIRLWYQGNINFIKSEVLFILEELEKHWSQFFSKCLVKCTWPSSEATQTAATFLFGKFFWLPTQCLYLLQIHSHLFLIELWLTLCFQENVFRLSNQLVYICYNVL